MKRGSSRKSQSRVQTGEEGEVNRKESGQRNSVVSGNGLTGARR